jgi:hypothetical protein
MADVSESALNRDVGFELSRDARSGRRGCRAGGAATVGADATGPVGGVLYPECTEGMGEVVRGIGLSMLPDESVRTLPSGAGRVRDGRNASGGAGLGARSRCWLRSASAGRALAPGRTPVWLAGLAGPSVNVIERTERASASAGGAGCRG